MAIITEYVQTANDGATHQSLIGGSLAAGGGSGTSGSPWNSWAQLIARITATGVSADDLVLNLHPACIFRGNTSRRYADWTGLGRGTNWRSITVQLWQDKIDAQPLYADWRPTLDTTQPLTSWTRGRISAGSFVVDAGSGDVYRASITSTYSVWTYVMAWAAHESKDCRIGTDRLAMIVCHTLSDVTAGGDCVFSGGFIYVKTGQDGVDPTARWGNEFVYCTNDLEGSVPGATAIRLSNSQNFTWSDLQTFGGKIVMNAGTAEGHILENCHFPRHVGRMRAGAGFQVQSDQTLQTSEVRACTAHDMILDAQAPLEGVKGAAIQENGADGLTVAMKVDGFYADNLKAKGFSHAQFATVPMSYVERRNITGANQFTGDTAWVGPYGANSFAANLYVSGTPDGTGWDARRSFYVSVSGTSFGTVTLQKATTLAGPWTDVKTWTSSVTDELFNDPNSDGNYYRLGVKTGEYSAAVTVTMKAFQFPRNVISNVTSYADGKGTLTCAPDITAPRLNYHRSFILNGQRLTIGPYKVRNQTTNAQTGGRCDVIGVDFDATSKNVNYTNPEDCNGGSHLFCGQPYAIFLGSETFYGPAPSNAYKMPFQLSRVIGTKHDLDDQFAVIWDRNSNDDEVEVIGAVVRDSGHTRYLINSSTANRFVTRRKTPFIAFWNSTALAGMYGKLRDLIFIPDPTCVGLVARKAATWADDVNASTNSYPATPYDDSANAWGSGRIVRNRQDADPATFGFDANLNYTGTRNTPIQTGPRRARYR